MAYNHLDVMKRDNNLCRLRFAGCTKTATDVCFVTGEYMGGVKTEANALSACSGCAGQHREQRTRAAELLNHIQGW
jgi:hypothetical protein